MTVDDAFGSLVNSEDSEDEADRYRRRKGQIFNLIRSYSTFYITSIEYFNYSTKKGSCRSCPLSGCSP